MIVIFPALTSSTINQNVLPGVAKALELYSITYLLENVLKEELKKNISINQKTKRLMIEQVLTDVDPKTGEVRGSAPQPTKSSGQNKGGSKPTPTHQSSNPIRTDVKIDKPWATDISLSPTWVRVDTPTGTKMVGVKVIPFFVKDDDAFIRAIGNDLLKTGLEKKIEKYRRLIKTAYYRLMIKKKISGDVMNDIIYARTKFGRNIFCIFDYAAVKDITNNPKLVQRLFSQFWSSLIFADDANQRVFFCMKHFTGICNMIPYQFLFSLTRQMRESYNDITDVASASSSIFSKNKKYLTKILGEAHAIGKVNNYTKIILEKDQQKG